MPNGSAEHQLYPYVATFLQDNFGCTSTVQNRGTQDVRFDVLGLRRRGNHFAPCTELLAVEVKAGGTRFVNYLGQAIGYSLYANEIYLAWKKPRGEKITQEEIDISSRFGVGMLHISSDNDISKISSSRKFTPERHFFMQVLQAEKCLNHFECILCNEVYPRENVGFVHRLEDTENARVGNLASVINNGKHARYWLFEHAYTHMGVDKK